MKHLGVIFDKRLLWKPHINELKKNCNLRLNILKVISGTDWGADRRMLLLLYKMLIRSKMDYASIVYSTTSRRTLQPLDIIQNTALQICTGALRSTPIHSLHTESDICTPKHHRNHSILKFYLHPLNNPIHVNSYCYLHTSINSIIYPSLNSLLNLPNPLIPKNLTNKLFLDKIHQKIQKEWTESPPSKIRPLKPVVETWTTANWVSQREEVVIARLRLEHTLVTHKHLFERNPAPIRRTMCPTNYSWTPPRQMLQLWRATTDGLWSYKIPGTRAISQQRRIDLQGTRLPTAHRPIQRCIVARLRLNIV
jgi:hypothetical protein